ncbi:MAG TPA: FapA family protein, partial [Clostridia bacterium]
MLNLFCNINSIKYTREKGDYMGTTLERNVNDGFYEIKYQPDGIFITVYPPVGKGLRVDAKEIIEKLTKKKIKDFNRETLELAILKAEKIPVKIADAQEEVKVDTTITVSVSPDKMKGYITLSQPEGGRVASYDEIINALKKEGVLFGLDNQVLSTMAQYPIYNETVCVAQGKEPVSGKNGYVEYHFDTTKDRKPTILDDGRVDFRELNLIECVTAGSKLCTIVEPKPGVPGRTVTGHEIPASPGKAAVLPKGKNIEVSSDGLSLLAAIDGQVSLSDGSLSIFASYEVQANVDNSTGNISFVGNVIVKGNVL